MKRVRSFFVYTIVGLCVTGFIIIVGIALSFGARKVSGKSNRVTQWFTQNLSLDTGFLSRLSVKYGDYNSGIEKYEYYAEHVKEMLDDLCTVCIPHSDSICRLAAGYENVLQMNAKVFPYPEERSKVVEMAVSSVVEFADFCESNNIKFIYVQIPSKLRYYIVNGMENQYAGNLTTEDIVHADEFVDGLSNQGIKVINLNEYQSLIGSLEFDYTEHWSAENALSATDIIIKRLKKYGILQDENIAGKDYYDALQSYTTAQLGYEYKLPLPLSKDVYHVLIDEDKSISGSFEDVFIRDASTWCNQDNVKDAYHKLFVQTNFNLMQVTRDGREDNQDFLMLGDSFSWPLSAYISQYAGRIDSFNPRYFGGNVKKYILINKPDVVILAFFDGQIKEDAAYAIYTKLNEE